MSLINTIACGDCREILPTLPAKSFQLAFADPPYWVGYSYGDKTDKDMAYIEPHWLVNELRRIAHIVVVTPGIKMMWEYPKPDWTMAWHKPASMSSVNVSGGANAWDCMLFYRDGKQFMNSDVITAMVEGNKSSGKFHSCPKPEKLLRTLIEWFTEVGDNVLDPVSGSGTTCKAAYQLQRNYLGIEIDPKYAELSLKRLSESQPSLLAVGGPAKRAADGGNAAPEFSNFE
jgi:adenine-specific DNA-methyltransferase